MNAQRRLVLVVLSLVVAACLVWLYRSLPSDPNPLVRTPARDASNGAEAANSPLAPPPTPQGSIEALASSVRALVDASGAQREENFELDDARWIEGRVELPAGAPADETLVVWMLDTRGLAETNEVVVTLEEDPGALFAGLHEDARGTLWSRRAPAADGSFRVPCPKAATTIDLWVDGRYAYLEQRRTLTLAEQREELVLRPLLGAWFTGVCTPPARASESDAHAGGVVRFSGLFRGAGAPPGGVMIGRRAHLSPRLDFELRGVPPVQNYGVNVVPERLCVEARAGFNVQAGEKVELSFTLRTGARVEGRVLEQDGQPFAGARVRTRTLERNTTFFAAERNATSAADGTFTLHGIAPGKLRVEASAEDRVRASSEALELADGDQRTGVELRLSGGVHLVGRVVLPGGKAATGARVRVATEATRDARSGRPNYGAERVSDADGRFRIAGLNAGPFQVQAVYIETVEAQPAADASAPSEKSSPVQRVWTLERSGVEGDGAELVLELAPPPGLRGRVVDVDGHPVARYTIHASSSALLASDVLAPPQRLRVNDEQGRFFVEGLPAGSFALVVQAEGYVQKKRVEVVEVPAPGEVTIEMTRPARVRGRVVDAQGQPLPTDASARVERRPAGDLGNDARGHATEGGMTDASCDAQGAFVLQNVNAGSWQLVAHANGWTRSAPLEVTLGAGQELDVGVLTLRLGGTIDGEVFLENGASVTGRKVQLFSKDGGEVRQSPVDASGRFREEKLVPGTYQLVLEPDEETQRSLSARNSGKRDSAELMAQLKLASCVVVDGEVVHVVLGAPSKSPVHVVGRITRAGKPCTDHVLMALNEGGALMQSLRFGKLDAQGNYELTLEKPGEIVLIVARSERDMERGTEFHASIPEVAEHRLDLELPVCALRGRVLDAEREPVPASRVELARDDGQLSIADISGALGVDCDAQGQFAFEDLQPGVYTVSAGGLSRSSATPRYGRAQRSGLRVEKDQVVDTIELVLEKPLSVEGTVKDARGQPVSSAEILARNETGELVHRSALVTSDATGAFTYTGLAPGTYTFSARTRTQFARDSRAVTPHADDTSTKVELTTEPGTLLRISVTDKDDKPLRASISIKDDRNYEYATLQGRELAEQILNEGLSSTERKFGPLPPGKYTVTATANGKSAKQNLTLTSQDERQLRLRLD